MSATHAFIASMMTLVLGFAAGAIWAHTVAPQKRGDDEEEQRKIEESAR
ncbi:MAG TPA: hypothetical protein VFT88_06355 [Acidobacteriaceae bacterium]|nr:hypothetical protein [Acidobacteriaceae bacterium]